MSREPSAISHENMPSSLLAEIGRLAEQGYPKEICGLVIGRPDDPETWEVRPIANIADAEPQADPAGVLRDAHTAYLMDPLEELAVLKEMDARGRDLVAIYHSHPDHDAYFSAMDRERALFRTGEPLWPGVTYLVVSVRSGKVAQAREDWWDGPAAAFGEATVSFPGT
jgi:[CysO sulfur-carrier protein]-S-L-cysteine hydrolase